MASPTRSQALAIAPKFTAFLSICGSLGIVLKVLCNPSRRKQTMHRIVMGMSVCDMLASIWYFTGTWAIPTGTPSWFGNDETETIFWAAGDSKGVSCSFAGFFNQFAVATPLYNTTLAVYYLLVVNFGWKDNRIAKIEWMFHAIPIGYALATSTFAAATKLYGHVEWTCWILPSGLFDERAELTPIQSKFQIMQWVFLFGIVWTCIIVVTIIFVILYRKMRSLERLMRRYSYSSTNFVSDSPSGSLSSRLFGSNTDFSLKSFTSNRELSLKSTNGSGHSLVDKETEPQDCSLNSDINIGYHDSSDVELEEGGDNKKFTVEEEMDDDDTEKNADSAEEKIAKNLNHNSVIEKSNESKLLPSIKEVETIAMINSADTSTVEACVATPQETEGMEQSKKIRWSTIGIDKLKRKTNNERGTRRHRIEVAKSKKIAVQGLLYVVAFYVTWTFPTVNRFCEIIVKKNYFSIQFLDTVLLPLQGFLNFIIYIRPRFLNFRRQNQDEGFWKSLKVVVFEMKIS